MFPLVKFTIEIQAKMPVSATRRQLALVTLVAATQMEAQGSQGQGK
jgi:hypothetical protein